MRTLTAPEGFRDLLALVDQPGSEPIMIQGSAHSAVLLSEQAFKELVRPNWEAFRKFSEQLSATVTARGLTEEKLSEILAEIDAETPR